MRASLLLLAQEGDRKRVEAEITEQILQLGSETVISPVVPTDALQLDEWESGVEPWQKKTMKEMQQYLGLREDGSFWYFNDTIDRLGEHDPWVDRAPLDPNDAIKLRPHWHQLVGMAKMLDSLFDGKPLLLMDSVGLGKTMQVVGVMALLVYFREYKTHHGVYPGAFST